MEKFRKFISRYGWFGLVRLFFYPVTTLLTTPVRLIQTLWECRVLLDGKWGDYPHFNPHSVINSLFYWTYALNIYRYGRSGVSPYLGLGNYPLSKGFYYSLISLYAYWGAGAITLLFGMFGWWLFHLLWLEIADPEWLILVMFLSLISTTFYVNTFSLQNYNALGWLFFPIALYGLMTGQWWIAAIGWLLTSFGSITLVFIGGILSLAVSVHNLQLTPLLAILPAGLKTLTHFWPNLIQGNILTTSMNVLKGIGSTGKNTKYKRQSSMGMDRTRWYYALLYIQFGIATAWIGEETYLLWTGIAIYFVNSTYARFADEQSMYMMMLSLATAILIQNENLLLLPFYWLLVSPVPLYAGFPSMKVLDVVPRLKPFTIKPLLNAMEQFLKPVQKDQRVLMVFDNPDNQYEKVFDGYRVLLELPFYIASCKKIHFMPDWWAVFEVNYEGAPEFWGRNVKEVLRNVEQWKVDYVVIYQDNDTELDKEWLDAGFESLTEFCWKDYSTLLQGTTLLTPTWWLLKLPDGKRI
ncbi:hypothetical protein PN36_17470 [Candidatus Thiomargarita nelsonii]|uniref:Glycosyltransferase RgtA/B/C/D-like domain-containing protein n=1 Tax=Candidatus Thiomargarita nelsonii TaxID=1003181 RepID=A0A4E0QQ86_9GAMM|nr:hypothetical protein PN36_17470 [Candidatus Thiomargarita nelsonii]